MEDKQAHAAIAGALAVGLAAGWLLNTKSVRDTVDGWASKVQDKLKKK